MNSSALIIFVFHPSYCVAGEDFPLSPRSRSGLEGRRRGCAPEQRWGKCMLGANRCTFICRVFFVTKIAKLLLLLLFLVQVSFLLCCRPLCVAS